MAITVKDIQEKDFSIQAENGYNPDQVDDFLDEVAVELNAVLTENKALKVQLESLREELRTTQAEKEKIEKNLPDYNESDYFKNLENALRESLISAQRIADQTTSDASRRAQQTIDDANAHADSIREAAEKTVEDLNSKAEQTRTLIRDYRSGFEKLIEEQLDALDKIASI